MDIAIKYEKMDLGYDKYVFKPVSVIKGKYDEETELFETEYGDLCAPIDGESKYEESYYGSLTSINELVNTFGKMSEEDLLMCFFEACNMEYCIGFYDYEEGRMQIIYIPEDEMQNLVGHAQERYEPTDKSIRITLDLEELKRIKKSMNQKDLNAFYSRLEEIIKYAEMIKKENEDMSNKITNSQPVTKEKEQKKPKVALQKEESKLITLKELRDEVKEVIKGQDKAVDDVTRAIIINQKSKNPRHKSHMLVLGPSGTGKTEIINIISKRLGIPYFKADATAYTKEGFVGKSAYLMFDGLIQAAGGDIKKAQNGILIIDEIDKKLSDDVAGKDVLYSLLKIMDREVVEVGDGHNKKPYLFDASNLTIIFMGAFADLYKDKEEKNNKKSIGFSSSTDDSSKKSKVVITNEDLIKAGMPPEFLGRIAVVTNTEELDIEDLVEILYKSKGGAIDEEKEFCEEMGITIKFTSGYMREIARKAHESRTGARDLRKLVRESVAPAYDEILSGKDVKVLKLTKKTAINNKEYYTE